MHSKCCLCHCYRVSIEKTNHFYKFPRTRETYRLWLEIAGITKDEEKADKPEICDNCFDPSSFDRDLNATKSGKRRKLKDDAVPLRFDRPYSDTDDGKRLAYQLNRCRICLKDSSNQRYKIDESIESSFFEYTGTKFLKSDHLSHYICNKCKVTLTQFQSMKKQFIANQNNLNEIVRKVDAALVTNEESDYEIVEDVRPKEEILETESYTIQENIQENVFQPTQESDQMTVDHEASYELIAVEIVKHEDLNGLLVEELEPEPTIIQFSCQICTGSFQTKEQLQDHLREHMNGFSCDACGFMSGLRETMMEHLQIHRHQEVVSSTKPSLPKVRSRKIVMKWK